MMMKKNENYKENKIREYLIITYHNPSLNHPSKVDRIFEEINFINKAGGLNYKFGIFKNKESFIHFSKNLMLSIIYLNEEPVGMYANSISKVDDSLYSCHLGNLVFLKNNGLDIVNLIPPLHAIFTYEKIGGFYGTSISRHPSVIESMIENSSYSYPGPDNSKIISSNMKKVVNFTINKMNDFFIEDEEVYSFDFKKNVINFKKTPHDVKTSIFEHSLAKKNRYNIFMNFWIKYSEREFLFLTSKYDKKCHNIIKKKVSAIIYYFNNN